MNPTDTAPPPPPPPPPVEGQQEGGPRVSPAQVRDLGRLRRSRQGRTVGGVCQGIARHLDIDPTVVKVVFVALTFVGGVGILLYAALWLLVPSEGDASAVIPAGDESRRVLLIAVGVVAALVLLGHGWGGWWFGGAAVPASVVLVMVLVVVLAVVLARRDGRVDTPVGGVPLAAGEGPPSPPPLSERAVWAPPPYVPPAERRPKRRGILLFLPTLALIAISLGVLGIYDADHAVDQSAYPALALAVTGAMLVLGAFWGRAGGLALIGIVAATVLAVSSATGGFTEGRRQSFDPLSAADVRPAYDMGTGELVLDLSDVADVAALDGRTLRVTGRAGAVEVIVPRDLRVRIQADVEVVGGIDIGPDRQVGGLSPGSSGTFSGGPTSPQLGLDLDIRVGQITVRNDRE